jgi:hypothetical protein
LGGQRSAMMINTKPNHTPIKMIINPKETATPTPGAAWQRFQGGGGRTQGDQGDQGRPVALPTLAGRRKRMCTRTETTNDSSERGSGASAS